MHVPDTPPFRAPGGPIVLSAAVATPGNIARAIALMFQAGEEFRVPLFRAVARNEIAISHVWPDQAAPLSRLDRTGRPSVLILSDDDDITRLGPGGWTSAVRAMRWAKAALVHGSGGKAEHYELAVQGALVHRRVVLVETSSALIRPWSDLALRFMPPQRVMRIEPFPGGVHPVPMPREQVQ